MPALDPYVYTGTTTLINRLGIRDPAELQRVEAAVTLRRLAQVEAEPLAGRYDLAHLKAFHRHIFGDLYPWAGETAPWRS